MDKIEQRVVVTDSQPLLEPGIESLRARGVDVEVLPEGTTQRRGRVRRPPTLRPRSSALMPFRARRDRRAAPNGLLVRAGIGYDIIDVGRRPTPGSGSPTCPTLVDEVADHALLLLLSALRRLTELERVWHAGAWVNASLVPPVHRIRGRRLGIVGFGRIGRAVAQRAHGFGFEVVAHDPPVADDVLRAASVEPVGLDELFATSDAITLHCPLTPDTRFLVGAERLSGVKPGLVLVNTSRGGLVDLAALEAALDDGTDRSGRARRPRGRTAAGPDARRCSSGPTCC